MISFEQFFGQDINYLQKKDFEYSSVYDTNYDDEIAIIIMALLKEWYDDNAFKSISELKIDYGRTIDALFKEVISTFNREIQRVQYEMLVSKLGEYGVDESYVGKTGIKLPNSYVSAVESFYMYKYGLRHNIKQRLAVWKDFNKENVDWNITPIFLPIIKSVQDVINGTYNLSRQKVERGVLNFVYADDVLYNWRTTSKNPCRWCIANEKIGAKPLKYWAYDHLNGQCLLVPESTDNFSDKYLGVIKA